MPQTAEIVVVTRRTSPEPDGSPALQMHSRVFVDGEELKYVNGITIEAQGGDFLQATFSVVPASVAFIHVDEDDAVWLDDDLKLEDLT